MTAEDSYLSGPRKAMLAQLMREYGFGQTAAGELLDFARACRNAFQRSRGGVLLHVHYARGSRAYGIREESPTEAGRFRNTAEPSGELPVGDLVVVGGPPWCASGPGGRCCVVASPKPAWMNTAPTPSRRGARRAAAPAMERRTITPEP